jgi:ABC-type methionine transport system permease subunit
MSSPGSPLRLRGPPRPYEPFLTSELSPQRGKPVQTSFFRDILPHVIKRIARTLASVILPIALLPFHFFFLILSIITTLLAFAFLSWRAFMVYVDIAMDTLSQVYQDYVVGSKRTGRRRRDLLRKVVLETVRAQSQPPQARGRGLAIA